MRRETVLRARNAKWANAERRAFFQLFGVPDASAEPVVRFSSKDRTEYEPDVQLRDFENVPLKEDIDAYFRREVLPHVPDAWMDRTKDKVGYEINFNRHFYRYTQPRPLEAIDADLRQSEENFMRLLKEVTA